MLPEVVFNRFNILDSETPSTPQMSQSTTGMSFSQPQQLSNSQVMGTTPKYEVDQRNEMNMGRASSLMRHGTSQEVDFLFLNNSVPDVQKFIPTQRPPPKSSQNLTRATQYLEAIRTHQQLFPLVSSRLPPMADISWGLERYVTLELLLQGYEVTHRSVLKVLTQALQHVLLQTATKLRRCIDRHPRSPGEAASRWVLQELDLTGEEVTDSMDVLDRRLGRWDLLSSHIKAWNEEADGMSVQSNSITQQLNATTLMEDTLSDVEIDEYEYIVPRTEVSPMMSSSTPDMMMGGEDGEGGEEGGEEIESASESLSNVTTALAMKRSRIS